MIGSVLFIWLITQCIVKMAAAILKDESDYGFHLQSQMYTTEDTLEDKTHILGEQSLP